MKIMVLDDSARMREMIRDVLHNCVDEFFECGNGNQAIDDYEKYNPDIVLMDIKMGEADGIIATEQIIGKYPQAKIFMVTNYDDPYLKTASENAGASEYILKDDLLRIEHLVKSEILKRNSGNIS